MKVIVTFTFCCDNLWKRKFMALEKPGKLGIFFLLLCGHPVLSLFSVFDSAVNVPIREMKDTQFLPEKVSSKAAKELFERFQEYERIYQKVFAGMLAASVVSS